MAKRKYIPCHACGKKDGARCRAGKGCDATKNHGPVSARTPDASTRRGMSPGGSYRAPLRSDGD